MSPWMRSACRIVCWCWIWLHRRVVNLGCGCGGDGNGVGVLVSLPPLALLGGVSVPGRCHRAVRLSPWRVIGALYSKSRMVIHASTGRPWQPWQPRRRTNRQLSLVLIFPLCSSLFAQTADGRRQSHTAGGCLAASGAAEWPMTPGLAIVNGRPCGTKAHVPPAVGHEIDGGSARPSCCLLLLVPQFPSAWGLATYSASFSSGTLYLHLGHRRAVNSFPLALSFFSSAPQPPPQSRQCSRRDVDRRASTLCPVPRLPPTLLPPTRAPRTR
jgi:hypothetical protein